MKNKSAKSDFLLVVTNQSKTKRNQNTPAIKTQTINEKNNNNSNNIQCRT